MSVDCAAYDADELETELFGPVSRSQTAGVRNGTGTGQSAQGRLYQARGGTLYLQNVAEAPTRVQLRLAQLLRDREARWSKGRADGFDVRPWPASIRGLTPPCRKVECVRNCFGGSR